MWMSLITSFCQNRHFARLAARFFIGLKRYSCSTVSSVVCLIYTEDLLLGTYIMENGWAIRKVEIFEHSMLEY